MPRIRRVLAAIAAIVLAAASLLVMTARPAAKPGPTGTAEASENEIVVSVFTYSDIVVNGRVRRCQRMAGDPLDRVNIRVAIDPHTGMPRPEHLAIVPDDVGGYSAVPNLEQITGPEFWQRVGVGMDHYAFRAPASGKPMCVGGRSGSDEGGRFAGFRRIVDAAPYRGKRLRFTAQVATGRAQQVSFWLAAGNEWREPDPRSKRSPPPRLLLNGGNTNEVRFGGNNGWTPVEFETGPIDPRAHHVSYGFNLQGSGDVWVYEPKLEIVGDGSDAAGVADRIVIGPDSSETCPGRSDERSCWDDPD